MTIRGLLERSVERVPGNEALKWCENKEWKTKTWFAFLRGIREVAEGYGRRFGLTAQVDNAAIILPNHPVWMESYLAQSGTGVSVIPIDPKLHNDEVAYILNDAEVQVVTTDAAHLKMMIEIGPQLPRLRAIVITDGVIFDNQKIDNRIEVIGYEKLRIKGGGERAIEDTLAVISPSIGELAAIYGKVERGEINLFEE